MRSPLYPIDRKRVIVTVISDLVTDYRVHKTCQTLYENGYQVLLIGTQRRGGLALKERDYHTVRLRMLFKGSLFFYLEFNLRLFFRILPLQADIYLGNDLDVMPATLMAARLKRKPIVYDSHEYFLGMAGMELKPLRRSVWKFIEARVFYRVKYMYTVSESIRNQYYREYHQEMAVVRNLPLLHAETPVLTPEVEAWIEKQDRKIPEGKKLLILQGAGINESRGAEELVLAMRFLDPSEFHLLIIGGGDVFTTLHKMVGQYGLDEKITLISKVPFAVLSHFTRKALLGFSIDKASIPNHQYSLPNKLFEYLFAAVPVLASRLIEQERIIDQYDVGSFLEDHQPEHIAMKIKEIFADQGRLNRWKQNTSRVREELNWENESKIVLNIFKQVEKDSVN